MDEMKDELFIDGKQEAIVINKRPVIDIVIVWQPQENHPVRFRKRRRSRLAIY